MNYESEKIKQIIHKTLNGNFIKLDPADITLFKKLSNNWSLKHHKNKKVVGVIIYFEFGDNHTLDDINKKAEETLKPLPDDVNAVWAGDKGISNELTATTIYLYK